MSPQSSQFPIYLKPTLDGTGTRAAFAQFEAAAVASGKAAGNAIRAGVQGGKIDLGITGLTQTIAEAKLAEKALIDIRVAATAKAKQDGDNSTATQQFVQALLKQQYAQTQIIRTGQDELSYYSKLQIALDATSSKQSRLAQLYRETYAEQIKAAQSDLNQRNFTNFAAPGLSGPSRSASDSAAVFAAAFAQSEAKQQAALDRTKQVMLESARASQQYESELRELIAVTNPAALAQEKLAQSIRTADQALARGDLSADAHALAMGRLNTVYGTMAGTMGVTRQATVQAGQQLQDIGISLYSGQQAAVVFAQQIPQLAFVLSSLEGSANKTHDRIGRFASFLAGPWGLLVGVAVGVAGTLIAKLFETGDAADKAKPKTYDFAQGLDVLTLSAKASVDAMQQLADATRGATRAQADYLDQQGAVARASIAALEGRINQRNARIAELSKGLGGIFSDNNLGDFAERAGLQRDNKPDIEALKLARQAQLNADIATTQRRVNEELDAGSAATGRYARAIADLDARRTQTVNFAGGETGGIAQQVLGARFISAADYEKEFRRLTVLKKKEEELLRESKRRTNPNGEGVASFRSREQAIGIVGREFQRDGLDVSGNRQFRVTTGHANDALHNRYKIDVDVPGATDKLPTPPDIKAKYDAHARALAQRGYRVLWAGLVYEPDGTTHPITGRNKHYGHMDIEAPSSIVGRAVARGASDAVDAQQTAQRAQEQFITQSSNTIASISSRFDDQPRLIDSVSASLRSLKDLMAELDDNDPGKIDPAINALRKANLEAQAITADAINRPLREMEKAAREQGAIDDLRIAGRAAEAELLSRTLDLQRQGAVINRDTVESIADQIAMEQRRSIELEKQNDTLQRNLQLVEGTQDNVRQGIRDLLGGKGFASIGDAFKRQFDLYLDGLADQFSEQLFGDTFRQQKLKLLGLDKVDEAGQEMATTVLSVAQELERLRKAVGITADALSPANDNSVESSFDAAFGGTGGAKAQNDILVNGLRKSAISVERTMTSTLEGFFGRVFGGEAAERITQGMMAAATGGALGGILGGRTGQAIGSGLGGLLGAVSGGQGGIGKLLSGLQSNLPVIGAVLAANQGLNSLLGNDDRKGGGLLHTLLGPIPSLFLGKKSGSTTISSLDGNLAYKGSGGYRDSVLGGGGSVQSSLSRILETLGGTAGNFRVSLGQRGKDFTVDPTGAGRTKGSGVLKFKTEEEAIRAALADALRDGAIAGISAGMQRLIQSGKDLDAQLAKAVKLQDVYDRLKQIDDPLGYAISVVDREFASLRKIATEAGEGMAEVERLYGIERLKVVKETNERITASLRDLYDELTVGNSALSLRDRKSAAQANYNPLADRVRAGDITAYDDYAKAARELLAIERELSGSQSGYFSLLGEVTDLTKARLDASTSPAANDNPAVVFAIGQLGNFIVDGLGAHFTAMNQNLGTLIAQGLAFGGGGAGFNYNTVQNY